MKNLNVWTDGASRGNPGKASWAVYCPDLKLTLGGKSQFDTNNRMEMTAILEAMKYIITMKSTDYDTLVIHSDSGYSVNTFSNWIWGWSRNGILDEKKNPELLKLYLALHRVLRYDEWSIKFVKVKGHSDDINNVRADEVCNLLLDEAISPMEVDCSSENLTWAICNTYDIKYCKSTGPKSIKFAPSAISKSFVVDEIKLLCNTFGIDYDIDYSFKVDSL